MNACRLLRHTAFGAVAVAAAMATSPANAQTSAYTTTAVNLRAGPDTAYPAVTVLPANTAVVVHGCLGGWSWCDVTWGYHRGWVAGTYLAAYWQQRSYPWTYVAPRYRVPVIQFSFGTYWDSHYRSRPWYRHRDRWSRWDHGRRRWRH